MAEEEIDSEEGARIERINQQCYLVEHHHVYAHPRNNKNGFKNITCMMGNPSEVLQKLSTKPGRQAFLTMTADKFSQLVPTIRLFKVPMDAITKKVSTEKSKKKEIRFKTYYELDASDITSNRSMRGDQVGLKELSYELQEGAQISMRQLITIKFIADSIEALQEGDILSLVLHPQESERLYDEGGKAIKGTDKPNLNFYALQLVYGWSLPPVSSRKTNNWTLAEVKAIKDSLNTLTLTLQGHELSYNENGSVEITAEYMGYADARMGASSANILFSSKDTQDKIAEEQKEAYKQETKIEAAKQAEETLSKRKDQIDAEAKRHAEKGDIEKVLKKTQEGLQQEITIAEAKKKTEAEKVKLKEQQTNVEKAIQADRQEKYSRILQELGKRGKIWFVDVDPETLGIKKQSFLGDTISKDGRRVAEKTPEERAKMSPEQRAKYDESRAKAGKARGRKDVVIPKKAAAGNNQVVDGAKKAIKTHAEGKVQEKKIAADVAKSTQGAGSGEFSDIVKEAGEGVNDAAKGVTKAAIGDYNKQNTASAAGSPVDGKVRINFVYWGDLFGIVLDAAYPGNTLPLRYLVGPINFTDPATNTVYTVNIADIPISLNLFTTWWLSKIVGPNLDVYTVRQFVRHSIEELIVAALGDDCNLGGPSFGPVGGNANRHPLEPPRISFSTVAAPLGQGQKDRLANKGRLGMSSDDIHQYLQSKKTGDGADWRGPQDQVEYMYLYCSAWTKKDMRGNRASDTKNGIYHINIGNDSGPIKKINFQKDEDISELMATQAQMEAKGIGQLVAAYDSSVSMIGNTLWVPSNYVYISPSALGIGQRTAQRMGLGGYYTVKKITGKVDSSGWNTDMECQPLARSAAERAGHRQGGNVEAAGAGVKSNNPEVKQK